MARTNEQLQEQIRVAEELKKERQVSDTLYALKIYEKALIAIISLFCLAVVGAMVRLILK
jgi:hypothetical protein